MRSTLLSLSLALLLTRPLTHAACYAPNGIREPNDAYQPCINIEGIHSMCCALNRTLVSGTADRCQQNGLCTSADGGSWRGFCTDKNWDSPGCLSKNICSDSTGGTSGNSNELTKCQDGTYCCNGGNTTCCSQGKGFTLNPTRITIQTASSESSSSTSSSTSPPTASGSSCTPSEWIASQAINKGTNATIIGVGVGVPLAVLAVVGSLVSFWLGQKRGRRTHTALEGKDDAGVGNFGAYSEANLKVSGNRVDGYHAPPGGQRPLELRGAEVPAELGGEGREMR